MVSNRLAFLALAIAVGSSAFSVAQVDETAADRSQNLDAIGALVPLIEREKEQLELLRAKLPTLSTAEERSETENTITLSRLRIRELRENVQSLATGVSEQDWSGSTGEQRSLNEEFQEIVSPILREMREATSGQREISDLKEEITRWEERVVMAEQAVSRLSQLPASDGAGAEELAIARQLWADRKAEADGELKALMARLADRERREGGIVHSLSQAVTSFWQSRGLNLLLAIGGSVLTVIAGNRLRRWLLRNNPISKKKSAHTPARLLELSAALVVALTASLVFLLILYLRGDWLLLSVAFVILVAIAITSRNYLPPYAEQVRTLLNLGPVREGERLIFRGIPWRLDTLGMFCQFSNPMLEGGTLRLHVRELSGLQSRPSAPKEPWFPTAKDDWVILSDETFGKIDHQTPEVVTVLRLGGSRKTYQTEEFLELAPENLSHGYRISSRFGVDYRHQAIVLDRIHPALIKSVDHAIRQIVTREQINSLKVEFAEANTSSLDFSILADFKGEAGRYRNTLTRAIQAACVAACNENGWTIPFPQLTLHQASSDPEEPDL